MKRFFLSLIAVGLTAGLMAQSVADGVKFLYYEQYAKAREVFSNLVKAKADDAEAQYWMGQVLIADEKLAEARTHYAQAMTATAQNPLIMVGMGHVELIERKNAEAKAHFEAAIAATKNRKNKQFGDPAVLAAIGRANADGGTEIGDPVYGVEKLQQAAQLDEKNPDIMLNMGMANLKRGAEFGGEAKRAFDGAIERDPNYARAYMRIGRIFESQRNVPLYLENYEKAIQVDPKYAPAYYALYTYYQNRDVNKAKELLDKYVANVPKDREIDFLQSDFLFRAGRYQESLDNAKKIETGLGGEKFSKLYKLYAYNYDRLGDSVSAKHNMEKYMNEETPSKLNGDDFAFMSKLYLKVGNESDKAEAMVDKAIAMDTVVENKLNIMRSIADAYGATQNWKGQYKWLNNMMSLRADTTARNFYFLADAAIKAEEYDAADKVTQMYIASYPDQPQGYILRNKAALLADPDTSKGTALPAIDQYIQYMMKDTARYKSRIITNIGYKVYYYVNKAKDLEKGIKSLDEILAIDPANEYAKSGKETLQKILNKKSPSPAAKSTSKLIKGPKEKASLSES